VFQDKTESAVVFGNCTDTETFGWLLK